MACGVQPDTQNDNMTGLSFFEWAGSVMGLLGAFVLATNSRFSCYGWLAFLVANVCMLVFAVNIHAYGLLLQQIGFTATSLLGIYRTRLFRIF